MEEKILEEVNEVVTEIPVIAVETSSTKSKVILGVAVLGALTAIGVTGFKVVKKLKNKKALNETADIDEEDSFEETEE